MQGEKLKEFGWLTLGTTLMSVGIYFFKFPNNFSTGGVSGIAVILGKIMNSITPGALVFIMNMVLLGLGFLIFGKKFGIKTGYASVLMSVQIWVLEWLMPMKTPFTNQPLLELTFAIMLPAFGAAILFNMDASSGGTDVIAMILKKYSNIDIGRALLFSDSIIVLACFFVFGMQTGLFSLLGLSAKALVVDSVIESINLCKYFTIITTKPHEVCDYIVNELKRGATKIEAQGAFTEQEKTIVMTVVRRAQGIRLQRQIKEIDDKAFVLITNTSEIIGKGFRGTT
ncbi:MAG: YitT family protein [Oscillospiraceae bacterium]